MFKGLLVIIGLFSVVGFSAPLSAASPADISIPVSTVVRDSAGSKNYIKKQTVDHKLIGQVCNVVARGENQSSVHPGNNLIIASGNDSVVLEDVERASGAITNANGQLTLGNDITVTLEMGKHGVFSGGMDVNFDCEQPKQIEVCRDGKVITIPETERKESDTDAPCPAEEQLEVCRDGEMVKIQPEERQETDTDACVLADDELPEQLPNTGAGSVLAGFLGSSALFAGARSWLDSRKSLKANLLQR